MVYNDVESLADGLDNVVMIKELFLYRIRNLMDNRV